MKVAALFVSRRSIYRHIDGVEAYDRARNAMTWPGGCPVIAHPPCRFWSRMKSQALKGKTSGEVEREKAMGLWAVQQVIKWGGVLEHPAGSELWDACELPKCGDFSDPFLFTVYIEQGWFGFPTPKPTWILCAGIPRQRVKVPCFRLIPKSIVPFHHLNSFERSRTTNELASWLVELARESWWQHR